jgi:hypothetical protein
MRKGQEEAPIELLLAVALLTFVIILGFYTYENVSGSLYEQKLKDSLSTFARNLELVYQGGMGTTKVIHVDFSEIGSGGKLESVRLIQGLPSTCMSKLGKDDCLQLVAVAKDSTGRSSQLWLEMLNIPSGVTVKFINAPASCTTTDLNAIPYAAWNDPAYLDCGWRAKSYGFKITKVSGNQIDLEQLGV